MRTTVWIAGMILLGFAVGYLTRPASGRTASTPAAREVRQKDNNAPDRVPSPERDRPRSTPPLRAATPTGPTPATQPVVDLRYGGPPDDRRNEPRDEEWAVSMERAMAPRFAARLAEDFPDAVLKSVTCRATSCTIEYDFPAERAEEIWKSLQLTMPHSPLTAPSLGEDDGTGHVRATFEAEFDGFGGGAEFAVWFDEMAASVEKTRLQLRDLRTQGVSWWK